MMLQVTEGPNISTHSCRSCQVIIQYLCRQIGPKVQSCFTFFQHPFLGELKGNKTEYYCEVIRLIDALLLRHTLLKWVGGKLNLVSFTLFIDSWGGWGIIHNRKMYLTHLASLSLIFLYAAPGPPELFLAASTVDRICWISTESLLPKKISMCDQI